MSDIAVIGAGYVGIPTAACFAHLGHRVVCADVDEARVRALSKGEVPDPRGRACPRSSSKACESGRLRFVVGAREAARDAEFVFICVQTPQSETGAADLSSSRASRARSRRCCGPGRSS